MLRHSSNDEVRKHFDKLHSNFATQPRNIRLVYVLMDFDPYIQALAKSYSCWLVTPYNLPPEMYM